MSTQNASSLQLDAKTTQNIIASRGMAYTRQAQAGDTVRFHIVGNGNLIPVITKDGAQVMSNSDGNTPLYKTIYNVKANSQIAMQNPRNRMILTEAMKAETAGEVELAHTKFNEYLNRIQVSFSVIQNPGRPTVEFFNKQLVEGELEIITTENGQLITVTNVRAVAVAKLSATPAFTLADLMSVEDGVTPETVFTGTGVTAGV